MSELAGTLETIQQLVQHNLGRKRRPGPGGVGAELRLEAVSCLRAQDSPLPEPRVLRRAGAGGTPQPHPPTRATSGELTPVPRERQPSPPSTCGCSPAAEVRSGTMWPEGPAQHNGRERAALAAEERGALGRPEQPAGSRAAVGTQSFHRDTAPGAAESAGGDGHTPESTELASEKFPGEGASLGGSGPTRKGPDRGGQSRGSRGQVGAHGRSGSPGDPPRPAPQLRHPERAPGPGGLLPEPTPTPPWLPVARPRRGRACSPSDCARVCGASQPLLEAATSAVLTQGQDRLQPLVLGARDSHCAPARPEGEEQLRAEDLVPPSAGSKVKANPADLVFLILRAQNSARCFAIFQNV